MATPLAGAVVGALFLFLVLLLQAAQAVHAGGGSMAGYVPVPAVVYRSAVPASAATTAEAYEPFELCLDCRCCPAAAGDSNNGSSCVQTRCCYGINCNIPGKPFGFCAFSPRSCGCGATGNCTNPT